MASFGHLARCTDFDASRRAFPGRGAVEYCRMAAVRGISNIRRPLPFRIYPRDWLAIVDSLWRPISTMEFTRNRMGGFLSPPLAPDLAFSKFLNRDETIA